MAHNSKIENQVVELIIDSSGKVRDKVSDLEVGFSTSAEKNIDTVNSELTYVQNKDVATHIVELRLPSEVEWTLIEIDLIVSDWNDIQYLAIGCIEEGNFYHVKTRFVDQGVYRKYAFSIDDLILRVQKAKRKEHLFKSGVIRCFLKATSDMKGSFSIKSVGLFNKDVGDFDLCIFGKNLSYNKVESFTKEGSKFSIADDKTLESLLEYKKASVKNYQKQVTDYLEFGKFPLVGQVSLDWNINELSPEGVNDVNTYAFSFHSLHSVQMLLLEYKLNRNNSALFSARDILNSWLDEFYFSDKEQAYLWYDHSVAERLITFSLFWQIGLEEKFDSRFMKRVFNALYYHGELLVNQGFYANNQNYKYHNHAWFQDLSLLIASAIVPEIKNTKVWAETALFRLKDQLAELINIDLESDIAVFVENSTGYHVGITGMLELYAELIKLVDGEFSEEVSSLVAKLHTYTEKSSYKRSLNPCFGDTFRQVLPRLAVNNSLKEKELVSLPSAGYAFATGHHDNTYYKIAVISSSKCTTHKHQDNLSFTLFFDGIEWLIDPSFYSHEYEKDIPKYLRSVFAHNTIALKDRKYSIEPGVASLNATEVNQNQFVIQGKHNAYEDVQITRKISAKADELSLCIEDIIITDLDIKSGMLMLHFSESVSIQRVTDGIVASHLESDYKVRIKLPSENINIYRGDVGPNKIRGITGTGFMLYESIYTVECIVPVGERLDWTIVADDGVKVSE